MELPIFQNEDFDEFQTNNVVIAPNLASAVATGATESILAVDLAPAIEIGAADANMRYEPDEEPLEELVARNCGSIGHNESY